MEEKATRLYVVLIVIIFLSSIWLVQINPLRSAELNDELAESIGNQKECHQNNPVSYFLQSDITTIKSPGILWNRTYGGNDVDRGKATIQCLDGGIAIIGSTQSYGAGAYDAYLMKIDADGNMEWNQTYGGSEYDYGMDLVELENGDLVFVGWTSSYPVMLGFKGWLVKTNSTGHFQWNMTYGPVGYSSTFNSIDYLDDGGFVMAGRTNQGIGSDDDLWVVRTDENGTKLWEKQYGLSTDDDGKDIIQCSAGGFVAVGTTTDATMFTDALVISIDEIGELRWIRIYGYYNQSDAASSVQECNDGGYIVAGWFTGFDGDIDGWLVNVNEGGTTLWQKTYGGSKTDLFESIYATADGDYIVAGQTESYGAIGRDGLIFEVDNKGEVLWNTSYGGIGSDSFRSVIECDSGSFFTAGETGSFSTSGSVWALKFSSLAWNESLSDQYVEFPEGFNLNLNVTLSAGLDTWSINNTIEFSIDGDGVIMNQTVLNIGTYGIKVIVSDIVGGELTGEFSVYVQDTTSPSWDTAPVDQFVEAGDTILYDLDASDVSGLETWSLNASPAFTIDGAGIITNQFDIPVGSYSIEVWVTDPFGNTLSSTFTIYVVDTLEPSWIIYPSDQILGLEEDLDYTLVATDFSGIDEWILNDTGNFAMSVLVIEKTVTFRITNVGTLSPDVYGLNLTISDPFDNSVSCYFSVTVLSADQTSPTWDEIPTNQIIEFGDSVRYDLNATDASDIAGWWLDDFTYFSIDNDGIVTNSTPLLVGTYGILVFTNDTQGNILSGSFTITVQDTTEPIWIIEPEDRLLSYGELLDYQLDAFDLSGVATWTLNDTIHFMITSTGRIFNIVELAPGSYGLTVTVLDIYGNQLSTSFSITMQSATTTTTTTTPGITTYSGDILVVAAVSSVGGGLVMIVVIGLLFRKKLFAGQGG